MNVTDLHPAEVLILTKGKEAEETEFMKIIVMNLVFNKVLSIKKEV